MAEAITHAPYSIVSPLRKGEAVKLYLKRYEDRNDYYIIGCVSSRRPVRSEAMKKFIYLFLLALGISGSVAAYAETILGPSCGVQQLPLQTPAFQKTPCNTKFAAGPLAIQTVLGPIAGLPANSDVAILNGMNAWNASDVNTRGRLTGWNGVITASDCPWGQPFQIGLMNFFALSEGGTCYTVLANGLNIQPTDPVYVPLAFVDYDAGACPGCGTKSISINTAVAWSTNGAPLAGQRDLQSVMAHEFGHVLGMGHHDSSVGGTCGSAPSPTCANYPPRSTMENINYTGPGETCGRDLGLYDKLYANQLYPTAEICQ